MDLDLKYRPTTLKQVVGQQSAVKVIRGLLKKGFPHKVMFSGPSGCGKTTLARIVANKLGCDPDFDFCEVNCADFRGIDKVRDIRREMGLAPAAGKCKVYLVDESHKMTNDAQTAMLKMLEEPPAHVYFMLATTEPQKMLRTMLTRVTPIPVLPVDDDALHDHIVNVNGREGEPVASTDVMEKIVELAEGSVRAAVKMFESVMGIEDGQAQLEALERQDSKRQAIEIARALISPKVKFAALAKILKDVDDEPEKIRHMVLGYYNQVMLKNAGNPKMQWMVKRAAQLIELFRDNWYDSGKSGLYVSCYHACSVK